MLERALKYNYEHVHFSKVGGLLPTTLLKMNSFTDVLQLFSNTFTNIYFAEQVSLATPESVSYRSIKNPYCTTFLVSHFRHMFLSKNRCFFAQEFFDKRKKKSKYRISCFIKGQ